ncbi:MAG TPA: BREX system P-loop protein BrxC [Bacteroidales bacterium]|nr:BREX system P-loop protein BrxC [Bacteroidales bacterium]
MKIKELFEKPVDRYIETVIKADDRNNISDEVTEYVITNEIGKKIRDLFSAYNDYDGANGVWISGFFGSGKSHLLKILSYVLENKEHDGYNCGELFAEKVEDDEMLKGDILQATRIPSESILFNIDQQAQITSKSDENAILSVFYKVFYDHLGFYGFQPHVAEFEIWLQKQGKYDQFKSLFAKKHPKTWLDVRKDYFDPAVTGDMANVLSQLNGHDASKYENILDELEENHKQSIEDFCLRVHEYIKSKPAGFRLNFFVDEVGQYISDNTRLMLNLQTIAETLATRTKGASWILVTSQEDMERVVGDMTRQQQNDFSRIQARFRIKIPLTSANVDEVIEKRLLKKKNEAHTELSEVYRTDNSRIDSLFSFSDAGVQFRGYAGDKDFSSKYPFIPYQFDLFQNCRRALSVHNAFMGKHASVGERSMLGVFQQVVTHLEGSDVNTFVSFDLMFEGIRNELRGEIQPSITLAEQHLDNRFAVRVLKTLFLVKYFGNFKTTLRNIAVLLIDDLNVDLKAHEKKVQEALNILENQSYIQRNGELYEFLTNDEKDVEEEIKNTEVDEDAVNQLLKEIFFDEIIKDNRIKFLENKQDYDFTSKIDGSVIGREKELEIEIITENNFDYDKEDFIKAQTMGTAGMKMVLAPNPVFIKDLKMYLKTHKYVRQHLTTSNRLEYKRILQDKGQQNTDRRRALIVLANNALAKSSVYMNGGKHEMGQSSDGKTRVIYAFQDLVKMVYPNLKMLKSEQYSEDTVKNTIMGNYDDLFGLDGSNISEAESEIVNLIIRRKKQSDRTSLLDLKTHFNKKPYGWYNNAIWTLTARLFKRGKVEIKRDANLLDEDRVLNALLNNATHANTLLEVPGEISPKAIKRLKEAYSDAFDESCAAKEGKDVANAFKDKLNEMLVVANQLLVQKSDFPFLGSLEAFSEKLARWCRKDYSYFLTGLDEFEDDLLDAKEDLLDPIKRFMNGDQAKIYSSIKKLLGDDTSNLDYVDGEELGALQNLLADNKPYMGSKIKDAKTCKDALSKKVQDKINAELDDAVKAIEKAIGDLKAKEDFSALSLQQQHSILKPLEEELRKLRETKYIARIRDIKRRAADEIFTRQLNAMAALANPVKDGSSVSEPKVHYVKQSNVKPSFPKSELKTEKEVDEYVEALKAVLKEHIRKNRRIQL